MKTIKKVILCVMVLLINLSVYVYAGYNYTYNFKAFSLTRDDSPITYNIRKNVGDDIYTNKDVSLFIDLNKPVDKVEGFNISENGTQLTKIISENEAQTIVVEDISGNRCEIPYNVNNIDKIPPEIIGAENGESYKGPKEIDYRDNVGIKNIYVDKYSRLNWNFYDDYYDTSYYKGCDITNSSIKIKLSGHPKNTSYYKYYLDGNLKAQTDQTKIEFSGLNPGRNYEVRVEALDSNNKVLGTITQNARTKYYKDIKAEKSGNTFKVTLYGIDSRANNALAYGYVVAGDYKYFNVSINPDRSLTYTFSALDITPSVIDGYYYFHIQLLNNQNFLETVCCNVIFNTTYKEESTGSEEINPYNLTSAGNYQIIVTDLAGNSTTKDITIT